MENNKKYDHLFIEQEVNKLLSNKKFYECDLNHKGKKFSILLPPPNITGNLHLGHAWDASLQDLIIRYKHMQGFNTLWISGLDHASIATQSKFEKILSTEQKKTRFDFTRKEFLNLLQNWSMQQAEIIKKQWHKLNLSLSLDSQVFTMDDHVNKAVNKWFVEAYKKGLVYRGLKLVNWDTKLQSAISDIEVIYKETKSKMYYFKYRFAKDKSKFLTVATTRPETMFGDICLVVNPKDKVNAKYEDKEVINPANGKIIKVITDSYVELGFGTGVMKCTPAHDFNDYALAKQHKINNYVNILNHDGKLNKHAFDKVNNISYEGLTMSAARKKLVEVLQSRDNVVKVEDITNNVAYSDRTGAVIEPFESYQWFVKMKPLAEQLIANQTNTKDKNNVQFVPPRFNDTLLTWMKNVDDWCISRQLWWGHQLPVWYNKKNKEIFVGEQQPKDKDNWVRDEDVFDTWFSSGLWPMACTFDRPDDKYKNFFHTSVLVTAYDILFFWIARMMNMTLFSTNKKPFDQCLIHGLIRDNQGRKMSKSLNNGIDPMDVVNQYGSDALKMFMTSSSTMGEDLRYSEQKIKYYWSFLNKLWNSYQLTKNKDIKIKNFDLSKTNEFDKWIINQIIELKPKLFKLYDNYEFSVANKMLIESFWEVYCNKYLEYIKPNLNNEKSKHTQQTTCLYILVEYLKLLYPICPMMCDYLYNDITSTFIWNDNVNHSQLKTVEYNRDLIDNYVAIESLVRDYRIKNSLSKEQTINLEFVTKNKTINLDKLNNLFKDNNIIINKIISKSSFDQIVPFDLGSIIFMNDTSSKTDDKQKRIAFLDAEIKRSKEILSNKNFINKAPKEKVEAEQQKLEKYLKEKQSL